MFSYYGSKSKVVDYYPKPIYDNIIEPFAGSARYSLKYFDREIILVDKYLNIVRLWNYLQSCSEGDIKRLPNLKKGDDLRKLKFDNEEELLLMRFLISEGPFCPVWIVSKRADVERQKRNIIKNLFKIKHWKIIHGDYKGLQNEEATWFIDPPYQFGGHKYNESNKKIDFTDLGSWCKTRKGQIIVCENTKADWMNFYPIKKMMGNHFETTEAIWTNMKSSYNQKQLELYIND